MTPSAPVFTVGDQVAVTLDGQTMEGTLVSVRAHLHNGLRLPCMIHTNQGYVYANFGSLVKLERPRTEVADHWKGTPHVSRPAKRKRKLRQSG